MDGAMRALMMFLSSKSNHLFYFEFGQIGERDGESDRKRDGDTAKEMERMGERGIY